MKFLEIFEILKQSKYKELFAYRNDYGYNRKDDCMEMEGKSEIQPFLLQFEGNVLVRLRLNKFPIGRKCSSIILNNSYNIPITLDIFEHDDWKLIIKKEIMENDYLW